MKLLEKRTRRCYSETFDDLDSHSFVEMMLLDGCFLLEFFLKLYEGRNLDSILEVGWNCKFIKRDLLLQENQIPFFIVDKLQELIGINQECRMLFVKYLAFYFLPKDYILPARRPPAETPDPPSEIPNPPDEIPDPPSRLHPRSEIPNLPAELIPNPPSRLHPRSEIPNLPAELIPDPPSRAGRHRRSEIPNLPTELIPDPPSRARLHGRSEIPNLPAKIPDRGVAAMPDNLAQIYEIPDPPAEIHHLVHLYYHYLVPNPEKAVVLISKSFDLTRMFSANRITKGLLNRFRSRVLRGRPPHSTSGRSLVPLPDGTGNLSSMVIPSATELKEAGLKFTPKCNPKHMLDISFEYGILKIPRVTITDFTKPIFTNLLAFEQSKYGKENLPFGRFLSFLDNLVNTPNDVKILQECGIIENWLGSEEELANFINQVTEGNFLESNHYLVELYTEVNRYAESSWHRNRAKLIRDYFSSPWATMSVVAAFILLVLTLVQSFFAVFAYVLPPKP
ncbi:uncharacterized protein LOC144563615 [Carex rostrata]